MSETTARKKEPGMAQLVLTLFAICAVCAILLGLMNSVTAAPIQAAKDAKTAAAMSSVLPADSYEKMDYTGGDDLVLTLYKAGDAGYVVEVGPTGFGGVIDMMVGVSSDGAVTGVSIISMSETSGLGANAKKDEFRAQFDGAAEHVSVTKDGGTIQALTGATITSRALSKGVNAALDAVTSLG